MPPPTVHPGPATAALAFSATGTRARFVTVHGDPSGADLAAVRRHVEDCERRWSRFRADSELSRLNNAEGQLTALAPDTFALVAAAAHAWRLTTGWFDPTVLAAVVAAGYDRSFARLDHPALLGAGHGPAALPEPARVRREAPNVPPGCGGIALGEGAVATSSRLGRRFGRDGRRHHLIDPATGQPAGGDADAAVVLAAGAARAEVLADAALVAGAEAGAELIRRFRATGLLSLADRSVRFLDGVEAFLR